MEEAAVKDYTESLPTEGAIAILRPLLYCNAGRILRQFVTMNWPDMLVMSGELSKKLLQEYEVMYIKTYSGNVARVFENISLRFENVHR